MNFEMIGTIFAVRRRSFLLLALFVLVDLALLLYLSLWQKPELERTLAEWSTRRQAMAAKGADRGDAGRYHDNERDLAKFQERIIAKENFAGFLSDLFGMAKANSLSLKGITYKPSVIKDQRLVAYTIDFNVTGKYAGAKSLIAELARYPRLVTLDSIALGNPSKTEETVALKVQLTVYLKPEGA